MYIVYERVQSFDGDGWSHWIVENMLSIHASLEGAIAAMNALGNSEEWYCESTNWREKELMDKYFVKP